ncbi:MAG: hypothetical protein RJS97_02855 [Parvibaculaceae bacterium]
MDIDRNRLGAILAALRAGEIGRSHALAGLQAMGMTEAEADRAITEAAAPPCPALG